MCTKHGAYQMCLRILSQFAEKKCWMAIDNVYSLSTPEITTYDFFPHIYYAQPDYQTDIQGKHLQNMIHTSELVF
jgi:hypothetical protein